MKKIKHLLFLMMFLCSASVFAAGPAGISPVDNVAVADSDSGDCD